MDTIGCEITHSQEQYILYGLNFTKKCSSHERSTTIWLPSLKDTQNVFLNLQYFIWKWDRGYDGGEIGDGIPRNYPRYIGVIPDRAIGRRLFTKINNETIMDSQGITINIQDFVKKSKDLQSKICNIRYEPNKNTWYDHLPKGKYDEYMLSVLKYTGFPPRIKRTTFSLNPFSYDYIETDEETIRKMGLVI